MDRYGACPIRSLVDVRGCRWVSAPLLVGLLLLGLAASLRIRARHLASDVLHAGLRLRESDDADAVHPARTLRAPQHGLVGRPDYLLGKRGRLVPVEVKPNRRAAAPYLGDLRQLSAYGLLVEAETGNPPPFGVLAYAGARWTVPWTRARRRDLLAAIAQVRADRSSRVVRRSHDDPRRCAGCGFREQCTDALEG